MLFGFTLRQYFGVDVATGALSGAVVFLSLRYLHDMMSLARDNREIAEDLEFVRAANLSVRGAHDETKKRFIEVTNVLARRLDAQEKKFTNDLKLIERYLSELSTNGRTRNASAAAPQVRAPSPIP